MRGSYLQPSKKFTASGLPAWSRLTTAVATWSAATAARACPGSAIPAAAAGVAGPHSAPLAQSREAYDRGHRISIRNRAGCSRRCDPHASSARAGAVPPAIATSSRPYVHRSEAAAVRRLDCAEDISSKAGAATAHASPCARRAVAAAAAKLVSSHARRTGPAAGAGIAAAGLFSVASDAAGRRGILLRQPFSGPGRNHHGPLGRTGPEGRWCDGTFAGGIGRRTAIGPGVVASCGVNSQTRGATATSCRGGAQKYGARTNRECMGWALRQQLSYCVAWMGRRGDHLLGDWYTAFVIPDDQLRLPMSSVSDFRTRVVRVSKPAVAVHDGS